MIPSRCSELVKDKELRRDKLVKIKARTVNYAFGIWSGDYGHVSGNEILADA